MGKMSIKIPKGHVLLDSALKVYPGEGAVHYAFHHMLRRSVPRGGKMSYEQILELCVDLVDGNIEEIDDPRVRRCQYCGYYYKDITRNNSSLVCSDECKTGKDILLKAYRRKQARLSNPKRRLTYKERYYAQYHPDDGSELEYPFWPSDFHMFEYDRKRGSHSHGDDIEDIIARSQLNTAMGGKKKAAEVIPYNGNEKGVKDVRVRFSNHGQRKPGEVVSRKMTRGEIDGYMLETYGAAKLEQERKRTEIFGRGRYF